MRQTVIGLAGHIDHGKTRLVKELTGVDTDTLAEEKRRGMTIDIGFAFLTENITLVDVPGHDRFVKNMVRGVAGIDIGLLVVAADDGIMPQTEEHFHILRLLGIQSLCIAISKIDLVDSDWLALVRLELADLLKGTSFSDSPVLSVSAETHEGLESLRSTLIDLATSVPERIDRGFFRMPIDRVFTLKGFGTVVTGTVLSGSLNQGDLLEVQPGNGKAKVRGLQSHGRNVATVRIGDRAAINVANLSKDDLERGQQLASPGFLTTSDRLGVDLTLIKGASPLKHRHPVRVNVGTAEVVGEIRLPTGKVMQAGTSQGAVLRLDESVPAVINDRFVLRSFSPITTIGGGVILDNELPVKWRSQARWVTLLVESPAGQRLEQLIRRQDHRPFLQSALAHRVGLSSSNLHSALPEAVRFIGRQEDPWLVLPDQQEHLDDLIQEAVKAYHRDNPYSYGANRETIRRKVDGDERFIEFWLKDMATRGKLKLKNDLWHSSEFDMQLAPADEVLLSEVVSTLKAQEFQTDTYEELADRLNEDAKRLYPLCQLAEGQGELIRVNQKLVFHKTTLLRLVENVRKHFLRSPQLTVADVKSITGVSRKYVVPLMEYLDRSGVTVRMGDVRIRPDV